MEESNVRVWRPRGKGVKEGAFHLATIVDEFQVQLADGTMEEVNMDTRELIQPLESTVSFGQEPTPYYKGEFMEIKRNDGTITVGRIHSQSGNDFNINLPFTTSKNSLEVVPKENIRRFRIYVDSPEEGKGILYMSPIVRESSRNFKHFMELEQMTENELYNWMKDNGENAIAAGEDTDAARAPKKKRKKKDPGAPKRAKSAYLVFLSKHREEVTAQYPELKMKDITKLLADLWSKAAPGEKQDCEAIAAQDRERYEKEKKMYVPPERMIEESNAKKRKSDSVTAAQAAVEKIMSRPKRPRTAYIEFAMQMREQFTKGKDHSADNLEFGDVSKLIGEAWRNLPEDQKSRLQQQSAERRNQYKVEKEHFEQEKERIQRAIEREQSSDIPSAGSKIENENKKRARSKKASIERPRDTSFNNEGSAEDMYIMNIIREGLQRVAKMDAYYRIVDLRRKFPENVKDGYLTYIGEDPQNGDWKAFLISCIGYDEATNLLLKSAGKSRKITS